MAPPPWTTPEQKEFLATQLPLFIQRQAEGKLHLFWPPVMEAWFKKYPEHTKLNLPLPTDKDGRELTPDELVTLGVAIKAKRSQIENWFRNHRKKLGSAAEDAVPSTTNAMVQRIFQLSVPKRRRVHQPIEIFQKRNKVAIVEALTAAGYDALNVDKDDDDADDWTDEFQDTPAARAKQASPEERAAVEAAIEEERRALNEEEQRAGLDPQEATPEERLQAIDSLDAVFGGVHRAAYLASGWVGMSIFGGPNPRMNGDLTLKIVCFGETPSGNDFEACCVDFDKNITQPFQDFLRLCFGDTANWALPSSSADPAPDERRVERLVAISAPLPPEKTKPAKKTRSKQSKRKSKSKKTDDEEESAPGASDDDRCFSDGLDSPSGDNSTPGHDADNWAPAHELEDFHPTHEENPGGDVPDSPVPPPWPAGMTAPLLPAQAAAIATFERGGTENPAVMAIDPELVGLTASSSPPRFLNEKLTPPHSSTSSRPTAAVCVVLDVLASHESQKTTLPASRPSTTIPVIPSSSIFPNRDFNLFGLPRGGPTFAPMPSVTPDRRPSQNSEPTPPRTEIASISAAPASPAAVIPLTPVFPQSRPQGNPATKPKTKAKTSVPTRKTSTGKTAQKKAAAEQAKKVAVVEEGAKKKRGRPRKEPLDDITNQVLDDIDAGPAVAVASAAENTTAAPLSMPAMPPLIFTSTNNNRAAAKAAAAAEKRAKEKEAEEARAKEVARGWVERTVDGATVVTTLPTRSRKRAKLPDGSDVQREIRGTRKKRDPCEALLARAATTRDPAAAKRKRVSDATASATIKKRKP